VSASDSTRKALWLAIATLALGLAVAVFVLFSVLSPGGESIVFLILALLALASMIFLFFYRRRRAR
jgi:LPXTG-motif cell wall-anchored protein